MNEMIKSLKILAVIVVILCLVFIIYQKQELVFSVINTEDFTFEETLFKNKIETNHNYNKNNNKTVNKKPRVLCLVTTTPKNHKTKALAVRETWGQRCDILAFVSSQKEKGLPIIDVKCDKEDHDHLWCKNRKGIIEAHKRFAGQYDWFYKADDDTYLIMENLKYLVGSHEPKEPVWFGCPFNYNYPGGDHVKYHSGGAGYVLSHEAVVRLIKTWDNPKKDCDYRTQVGPDDLYLGRCFEETGVKFGDERDESGRPRFFPFSPQTWLNPRVDVYKTTEWFNHYSVHHYKMGNDCCSNTSISFHYVPPNDMYVYDFFLYHLKVHKEDE